MSCRDKRPLKPFEWGFLVLLLAVLLYVAASLWGVVAGGLPNLGRALADGEIRFAVGLSLWTTTLSTLLCILIGIPCAYLLAWSRGMGEFGATLMLVGVTRLKTETLPASIYLSISTGDNGMALAAALLLLLLSLAVQGVSRLAGRKGRDL